MIHSDKKKCTGCTACQSICPKQCIKMVADDEGFLYPEVNTKNCVNCGLCRKVCPSVINAESVLWKKDFQETAYGLVNSKNSERENSSSGGAFSLIANWIIENGGVVFGVFFDDEMRVCHGYAETHDEIEKFRGSKYVQSDLRDTFHSVKAFLEEDRWILFTGTGCQIEGLLSYLGREYDKLFCLDIACYGTTSPRLLEMYIKWQEKKYRSNVKKINFRDKSSGWKNYSVSVLFNNQKKYLHRAGDDLYMRAFLSKLYLRPSCYSCSAKGVERKSDITLADFWGVEKIMPQKDDDKGCSLVIIHTEKGMRILEEIRKNAHVFEVDTKMAVEHNPAIVQSAECPEKRRRFIEDILNMKFNKVIRKYCSAPLMLRIKIKVHRMISKLIYR